MSRGPYFIVYLEMLQPGKGATRIVRTYIYEEDLRYVCVLTILVGILLVLIISKDSIKEDPKTLSLLHFLYLVNSSRVLV